MTAMRFASLGSGSKGNATLVESGDTCVLVDCGFSVRETERRLARLGREPGDLAAILVTHEHGDHWRGVAPLARKFDLPVYMTAGTARAVKATLPRLSLIDRRAPFAVGALAVTAVTVPHDAREPVQFLFRRGPRTVGVLTDLGCITPHVVEHYKDCDGLLLEANHDPAMLAQGPYPPGLKRRVGGDWGHLNNGQAATLLAQVERRRLQKLVLGHISLQNNRQALVAAAIDDYQGELNSVHYACQDEGFDWQLIDE